MSIKENVKIEFIQGDEGVKIKQYFGPQNTSNAINYSIAQFLLESGKQGEKMKKAEKISRD